MLPVVIFGMEVLGLISIRNRILHFLLLFGKKTNPGYPACLDWGVVFCDELYRYWRRVV